MKKIIWLSVSLLAIIFLVPFLYSNAQITKHSSRQQYQEGDIIFQSSNSRQCEAVKLATHSDISHCGILCNENNQWYVIEAVEPVQIVSLNTFIARGIDSHYKIKRLKKESNQLTDASINAMMKLGHQWIGKHYDIYFGWGNDQLYCSELVWKMYHDAAKIDLCALRKLKEFDLSQPLVKEMMRERYGNKIPYDENMVAPSDIYNSPKLELVDEH